MMKSNGPNNPVVVWGICYLWLSSMAMIVCAIALFYCVSDIVGMLRLDVVLALSLLSGLVISPANVYMLYMISKGERIEFSIPRLRTNPSTVVLCCPLWLCMISVIIINLTGVCLCAYKIHKSADIINQLLTLGMQYYRSNPKYKHFMDTIQWAIKCCGLDSYTDWFSRDWYDKIRDYEWDPSSNNPMQSKADILVADSVPLSCCKTGSCVSNYLMEMGTASINSNGCARQTYRIVKTGLIIQLIMFASVIVVEVLILCCLALRPKTDAKEGKDCPEYDVQHILTVNPKFESSGSLESISDSDTDDTVSLKELERDDE